MAESKSSHGDHTGRTKARLAREKAAEQKAAEKSMAMATAAVEEEKSDDVVDVKPTEKSPAKKDGEIEVLDVETEEKQVTFKVNANLEQVTIGAGNFYDFEQGRTYKAPKHIYDHLEEKGLIWH